MRILHLIQSAPHIYGAERCMLLELPALRQRGHDASALVIHESRMGEAAGRLQSELEKMGVPVARVTARGRVSVALLSGLWRALRQLRPDVVHSHSMKADVLGFPLARLLGLPFIVEVHGYLHPDDDLRVRAYEALDRAVLRRCAGALVLSRDYQRELLGYGVHRERIHLVPSGIDVAGMRARRGQRDLRAELGLPLKGTGPLVLGMVARLSPEKGHREFLSVLQALRAGGRDVRLLIVGEGPLRDELVQQVQALSLAAAVCFTGYVADIAAVYEALDVLVSCSRYEGLPLNLIEAMALGCPLAAFATGGCADIVADGETGLLVPRGDWRALEWVLLRLEQDAALRQRLGQAGAARAEARYSLTAWAAAAEKVYAQVLARKGRA